MNEIKINTRHAIFNELVKTQLGWWGRLDHRLFAERVFNLNKLPSNDKRFNNASDEIQHKMVKYRDWKDDWIFYDKRFNLEYCDDKIFLRFLCTIINPAIFSKKHNLANTLKMFNEKLKQDGWEIRKFQQKSRKSEFKAYQILGGSVVVRSQQKVITSSLNTDYIMKQFRIMDKAIDSNPDLAIGTAKEFIETITTVLKI